MHLTLRIERRLFVPGTNDCPNPTTKIARNASDALTTCELLPDGGDLGGVLLFDPRAP